MLDKDEQKLRRFVVRKGNHDREKEREREGEWALERVQLCESSEDLLLSWASEKFQFNWMHPHYGQPSDLKPICPSHIRGAATLTSLALIWLPPDAVAVTGRATCRQFEIEKIYIYNIDTYIFIQHQIECSFQTRLRSQPAGRRRRCSAERDLFGFIPFLFMLSHILDPRLWQRHLRPVSICVCERERLYYNIIYSIKLVWTRDQFK